MRKLGINRLFLGAAALVLAIPILSNIVKRGGADNSGIPSASDIVGCWMRRVDSIRVNIVVCFRSDGTFEENLEDFRSNRAYKQQGHWNLKGRYVELDKALCESSQGWDSGWSLWELRQSQDRNNQYILFGGTFPDPDVYGEFLRLSSSDENQSSLNRAK